MVEVKLAGEAQSLIKTAAIIFLIDIFWLLTGGIFARRMTENIQGYPISMRWLSAAIVYIFLAYMMQQVTSLKQAFIYGCCIYGVYDFTSHSIYSNYEWKFAIADTLWGGVLFSLTYLFIRHQRVLI